MYNVVTLVGCCGIDRRTTGTTGGTGNSKQEYVSGRPASAQKIWSDSQDFIYLFAKEKIHAFPILWPSPKIRVSGREILFMCVYFSPKTTSDTKTVNFMAI